MRHPEHFAVGMLGLSMAGAGALLVFVILVVVVLREHRSLPAKRSRAKYWIGMAVLAPLALAGMPPVTSLAVQHLAIISSYGRDAYDAGLRVINKHGQLSNGQYLSVFWAAAMGGGAFALSFLCVIPAVIWHMRFRVAAPVPALLGIVRLDGRPLPGALVAFHVLTGREYVAVATVESDSVGRFVLRDLPRRTYAVTVADGAAVPPDYGNPARTPLAFVWDHSGSVSQHFDLASAR